MRKYFVVGDGQRSCGETDPDACLPGPLCEGLGEEFSPFKDAGGCEGMGAMEPPCRVIRKNY
jgi:hypothetical protein